MKPPPPPFRVTVPELPERCSCSSENATVSSAAATAVDVSVAVAVGEVDLAGADFTSPLPHAAKRHTPAGTKHATKRRRLVATETGVGCCHQAIGRSRWPLVVVGSLPGVEGKPKSPQDQLQEIEKLVTDAARLLDQAVYSLGTVAARLKDEANQEPQS